MLISLLIKWRFRESVICAPRRWINSLIIFFGRLYSPLKSNLIANQVRGFVREKREGSLLGLALFQRQQLSLITLMSALFRLLVKVTHKEIDRYSKI